MYGLSGNIENARRNEPNIKNSVWRNKWYPNRSINEVKAIQRAKQEDPIARGALQFIKLPVQLRKTLIAALRNDPQLLPATVDYIMPRHNRTNQRAVTRYLALQRNTILADPRLQGGSACASRRTKKLRQRRRLTRR